MIDLYNKDSGNGVALSQELVEFDDGLYEAIKGINILSAVSPSNFQQQKQAFFDSFFSIEPNFAYVGTKVDVFATKRKLFSLPLENVKDEDLHNIYFDTINSYVDKVDQFNSIGTPHFMYDSLRYFGEPTQKDLSNARFILHLPEDYKEENETLLDVEQLTRILSDFANDNKYQHSLKLEDNMIANALVSGTTIKLNKNAKLSLSDSLALANHEIGVHLVTTLNARVQPLKILEVGNPLNTMTQEGLAILSEYLSNNLTVKRLKILALRVVAVESMIKERSFRKTFLLLREEYGATDEIAFSVSARIYRGGGFVKDYLYLQGFHKMLHAYESESDFNLLFAGKVSLDYLPQISRLVAKGILHKPKYLSPAFTQPSSLSEVKQFIAHAIK